MKTGDWGELTGFMIKAGVSVLGWIRLGFLGTELRAGLYMAYWADMLLAVRLVCFTVCQMLDGLLVSPILSSASNLN